MGQLISFKYDCIIVYEKFSILIVIAIIFSVLYFIIDNNHFNNSKTLVSKYSNSDQHFLIVFPLPLLQKMYLKLSGSLALMTCHSFFIILFMCSFSNLGSLITRFILLSFSCIYSQISIFFSFLHVWDKGRSQTCRREKRFVAFVLGTKFKEGLKNL